MKKKIFIIIASAVMAISMAACSNPFSKNYVAGYTPDEEAQMVVKMMGSGEVYIFEYDAKDYNFMEIYAERYVNGERIEDMKLFSIGRGQEDKKFSGKLAITMNKENQLRFADISDYYGTLTGTDFKDMGVPAEGMGTMMAAIEEKTELGDDAIAPLMFVGYYTGGAEQGYGIGLPEMDETIWTAYDYCYRVVVKFYEATP